MKYLLMAGVVVGLAAFGLAPRAQGLDSSSVSVSMQPTTLEGCLKAGAKDGEFALSAGGSDYVVMPGIGVELAGHVNRQVQVTGSVEKGSRGNVLRASAVKLVSETCSL